MRRLGFAIVGCKARRVIWRILPAFVVVLQPIGIEAAAQNVSGIVREATSRSPVPNAAIIAADSAGRVVRVVWSDSSGGYHVALPGGGRYRLSFKAPGLAAHQTGFLDVPVSANLLLNVDLSLGTSALRPVVVSGEREVRAPPGNRHKYDEFLRRKNLGMGTFLTREDIEARPVSRTQQLFTSIPGLKVRQIGTRWILQSQRCSVGLPSAGKQREAEREIKDPKWYPILFIDGFRVNGIATLNDIHPTAIEAIEVYQGAAQLPAEARGDACAAIFVWLK